MTRLPWAIALVAAVTSGPLSGAENKAEVTLVYPCRAAARPVKIDGQLEDDEWADATVVSGFTVSGADKLAPEQVVMRLLYDQRNLYVGVVCRESNMKKLKTTARVTDGAFWLDDSIEFFIDANHDHETYRQFAVTAAGVRYDNAQGDSSWNSNFRAAAQRGSDRWSVEVALPLADIKTAAPKPGTLWGFNLCRERQAGGKLELYNWANVQRAFNNVHLYGHLYFVGPDWRPAPGTVADTRRAQGRETRVFVRDGYWKLTDGAKPQKQTYRLLLKTRGLGAVTFMEDLKAIYQKHPRIILRNEFERLDASYTTTKALIAGREPVGAETWAQARAFLDGLQTKVESIYWQVRLEELNQKL